MKIAFVSNYFNHHQKPFCDEMYHRLGMDFVFIATSVMSEERKKLGYEEIKNPEYVYRAYEGKWQYKKAISMINEADVVIAGANPNEMLEERIRKEKLLFRYSERPFKINPSLIKRVYHSIVFRKKNLYKKNIYMLCASAYVAKDFISLGMYKEHTYKWGYFPEVIEYDIDDLLSKKKTNTILWCGRFIDWKHPDDAIKLAEKLKMNGYDFHLNIVGTGCMEDELKKQVEEKKLYNSVHFLGSMPPDKVRSYMEAAGIYIFTSDRQEGWGAVLNEAMNSGCTVIAAHEIGSVPFLIRNGENGVVYESGNIDILYKKVKNFLDNPDKQIVIGKAAYQTMVNEWNAKLAADRFLQILKEIQLGTPQPVLFESGPCSKADVLKENWFKEKYDG